MADGVEWEGVRGADGGVYETKCPDVLLPALFVVFGIWP